MITINNIYIVQSARSYQAMLQNNSKISKGWLKV
jgi:hypothetical protein